MLIDSHCHLHFSALSKDGEGVLTRARAAGIERFLNVCTSRRDFDATCQIAESHDDVICSFGVHPHHAAEEGEDVSVEQIVEFTKHPKVIAIGETGLDYFYNKSPPEKQQETFRRHIRAARATKLPLIIHSRDAEQDTLRILDEEGWGISGILHCFSSKRFLAEDGLKHGLYVSFSGILTFNKSEELRGIAKDVPMDRLLVETDAPYLAPLPFRGKVCEPAYVAETARVLADVKGVGFDVIARQTTDNFYALFRKCPKAK